MGSIAFPLEMGIVSGLILNVKFEYVEYERDKISQLRSGLGWIHELSTAKGI